jgi:hypothetical protein
MLGIQDVAIGSHRPRQPWAIAELGVPATPHAISHQGAFVFGHCSPHLQAKLLVRISTPWTLQELYLAPVLRELLDEEHLMPIVAC